MQQINRDQQKKRTYHKQDQAEEDDVTVLSKVKSLANEFKKQ